MRAVEFIIFAGLAAGVHAGGWALWSYAAPQAASGGIGGQNEITLRGASAELSVLATAWETPPDVTTTANTFPAPKSPGATPTRTVEFEPPSRPKILPKLDVPTVYEPPIAIYSAPLRAVPVNQMPKLPTLQDDRSKQSTFRSERPISPPPAQVSRSQPEAPAPLPHIDQAEATKPTTAPKQSMRPPQQRKTVTTLARKTTNQIERKAPAQRAAGTGKAAKVASNQRPKQSGTKAGAGQLRSLEAQWGASIQSKVQRNARISQTGRATVRLSVRVARSGKILGISVAKSSGKPSFDTAALQAVKRARRFKSAPSALPGASFVFMIPVRFQ